MQFNVLGAVEVLDSEGAPVELGGAQQRAVLAMLLVATDRVVPVDTIVDRLWGEAPPGSATGTLQSYISRLRRAIDPTSTGDADNADRRMLAWEARGYRLHPGGTDVLDFLRFEALADRGRELLAADDAPGARGVLVEALALWRGPALAEFSEHDWAQGVASRFEERRQAALEDRIRADLRLGRHELVIGELTDLVAQHELHEGFRELYALALYRSGRQAEALRAIDDLRRQLVDSLGVDPSRRISQLETHILDHDPTLTPPDAADVATGSSGKAARPPLATRHLSDDQLERVSRHVEGVNAFELVGRQSEQAVLAEILDAGLNSVTQWVVIEGEPGIGKTRLLEHLAQQAIGRGYEVFWGRCYESGAPPAFWLWLGALRGLLDDAAPLPDPTQELIDRLLSPAGDLDHVSPVDSGRFRLFEAIQLLLQRATRRQPVMLALDDVQWADPASLELIEFIGGSLVGDRLVIACTVRQLELARNDIVVHALSHISRRPLAKRLQLHGLEAGHSAELARLAVGGQLPQVVLEAIHRRSEGNPFFVGELARLLVADEGLSADEQLRRAAVPAGVRDVVHRRLVRLPPATVELLQVAATIGRETSLGLLSRAAGVSLDQCVDDLDPAFVNRLVVEATEGHGSIRFSHALVREVVLDDMSVLRRSRLHLRVADALETARDSDPEILAEHLWEAATLGAEERAAVASERAAEVALQRFAYETAATFFERAIQLRAELPPERADHAAELDALSRLIQVRRALHGFEGARVDSPIERAKELARATNREGVLTTMLWTEWAGACTSCDFELAHQLSLELRDLAADSEHPVIRATGDSAWGILCWHLGQIGEAVTYLDRAIAEFDAAADRPSPPLVDGMLENQVLTRCFHSFVHTLAGDPAERASSLPAMAAHENDPYEQLVIGVFESLRALVAGELDHARDTIAKARAIEVGDSFALFGAGALSIEGCVMACMGDPVEGMSLIEGGVAQYGLQGVRTFVPFYASLGAQGLATAGELDDARRLLETATSTLERTGEAWQGPIVLCARARVVHASGDRSGEVGRVLGDAYELALAQGALGVAAYVARAADELDVALEPPD